MDNILLVRALYDRFNARDIDGVLAALADDVLWANAMEGGHVEGHDGVRDYWLRQWAMVSPRVEPIAIHDATDGTIEAEVRQTILDLDGQPLGDREHGLVDAVVTHVFHLRDGKVVRFDAAKPA